ncbi:cytidine deaminase [Hydrogenimonas sp.]
MNLFEELDSFLERAYAPYSGFRVASIVVTTEGKIYRGVNVESVAYPTTMCAERNAVFHAVAEGVKPGEIAEVHILARNEAGAYVTAFPCGSCRQVIAEQSRGKATIHIYRGEREVEMHSIASLLPFHFASLD